MKSSDHLYKGLLAYALVKGAARGVRRRKSTGLEIAALDNILKDLYLGPVAEALHQESMLLHLDMQKDVSRQLIPSSVPIVTVERRPGFWNEPVIASLRSKGKDVLVWALPEPPHKCSDPDDYWY